MEILDQKNSATILQGDSLPEDRLHSTSMFLKNVRSLTNVEDGIAITSYGQGQVAGAMYTVPAHGEITVDFTLNINCVTPEQVQELSNLTKSLLDASRQQTYTETSKLSISGGASFLGMFGRGGAKASYQKTKQLMNSMGLSEENQKVIVTAAMQLTNKFSPYNYKGTIYNRHNNYSVSGSLFAIVMDADIQFNQHYKQLRFLAPNPHLVSRDGTTLPTREPLYALQN